jgi:tetratricopeptide (TPR) repeat protein
MQILFFLRYLALLPVDFAKYVWTTILNFQSATPRQRAMLFSLPAVFTAITGLTLLGISSTLRESTLLTRYRGLAEGVNAEFKKEFLNFVRIQNEKKNANLNPQEPVRQNPSEPQAITEGKTDEDPELTALREKLREMRDEEILYWQKLINLQPSNDEFRYRHALAHQFLDNSRMLTLLTSIAPPKQPGYKDAHLWLAEYYHALANQNPRLQKVLMGEAINHADQCLLQEKANETALQIKGEALFRLGQYESASEVFVDVVKLNPTKFLALVELNELRRIPASENELFLRTAKIELKKRLKIERNVVSQWERNITALVQCLSRLRELPEIRDEMALERKALEKSDDKTIRFLIIDRLLGDAILADVEQRIADYRVKVKPSEEQLAALITDIKEAKALLPERGNYKAEGIKRLAVGLGIEFPTLQQASLEIYDPATDPNPPAFVYDRLGVADLLNQNYSSAIQNLEKAINLDPENPTILNNLAFAYLSRNTRESANQAVLYSELALKALEGAPQSSRDPLLMSNFHHTRGSALMAIGDYVKAAGYFEQSLIGRPTHKGTLESLVKCFDTFNQQKADYYRQLLDKVIADESDRDNKESDDGKKSPGNGL